MGDVMLHGVLNMPPELWSNTNIDKLQRYDIYMAASRRIEDLDRKLDMAEDMAHDFSMLKESTGLLCALHRAKGRENQTVDLERIQEVISEILGKYDVFD